MHRYPKLIAVPRQVTDEQLAKIAKHRTRGRLPALSFVHGESGAVLVRCSQPRSGIKKLRCEEDEFYFKEMIRRNPGGEKMIIYDARPFLNAAWNRGVKGAGYEDEEHYNCKVVFLNIPNIHRVKVAHDDLIASFYNPSTFAPASALLEENNDDDGLEHVPPPKDEEELPLRSPIATPPSSKNQLPTPPSTPPHHGVLGGAAAHSNHMAKAAKHSPSRVPDEHSESWLSAISKLLEGSIRMSKNLQDGICVVVHCSDGWDRTPQITSLVMLLSDPFYRTLMGFQILIEFQWISFGHKFSTRLGNCARYAAWLFFVLGYIDAIFFVSLGHGCDSEDPGVSPVFLQWLDCCWQLLIQQPSEFQFTERLLFGEARFF